MASAEALVRRYGHMPRARLGALEWLATARPSIAVVREPLPRWLRGYALRVAAEARIVLNAGNDDPYPWVTLAHELGHLETGAVLAFHVLPANAAPAYWELRCERDANRFAARLLIPLSALRAAGGYTVEQAAALLRVPTWLLPYRPAEAGVQPASFF